MSTTPTCYNVGNGAVASSECGWNQVDGANMLQNNKPTVWNGFQPYSVASVPVAYIECRFESSGSHDRVGMQIPKSPGCSAKPGAVKKPKRYRTAFTTEQVLALEAEYARNRFLARLRRLELAKLLRLEERALKIWFQNRRMKEKKDREDSGDTTSTSECSEEDTHTYIPIPIHEHQYLPATSHPPVMPVSCPPPAMPSCGPPTMPLSWLPPAMPKSYFLHSLPMPCQIEYQQTFRSSETEFLELEPELVPIPELGRLEFNPSTSSEEKDWELTRILSALYGD